METATTVDTELDRIISKRASQDRRPTADELEPSYVESVRRHNAKVDYPALRALLAEGRG